MKTKKLSTLIAFLLIAAMLFAVPAFAQSSQGYQKSAKDASMADTMDSAGPHPFRVSNLIDKEVKSVQGDNLGKINDVVIGPDGRADFIIISHGGMLGIGEKLVPVPWKTVMATPHADKDGNFVANLDRSKLDNAPSFSREDWPNLSSKDWQQNIYSYYGVAESRSDGFTPGRQNR